MSKGIIGVKLGMTQVFDQDGRVVPVTAVQVGPCVVIQKKTIARDGYNALQLGFRALKETDVNKPLRGHFKRSGVTPYRYLKELRLDNVDDYEVGQVIKADIFTSGELVDVTGTSKGKGFAGAIKRHGFHRGPMEHGSKYHRRPGSLAPKGPARVMKGRKLPGRMGGEQVTTQNLDVVRTDAEQNFILIKGSVPGPRRGMVIIKTARKAANK